MQRVKKNNIFILKKANCMWWKPPDGDTLVSVARQQGWEKAAKKLVNMLQKNKFEYLLSDAWQYKFDDGQDVPF